MAQEGTRGTKLAAMAICLAAILAFAWVVNGYYPIRHWLLWHYATLWLWELLWVAGCLSAGDLVLVRLLRVGGLPRLEAFVQTMATGVVAFTLLLFVLGSLGLFEPWVAVALPICLLATSTPRLLDLTRRVRGGAWPALHVRAGTACLLALGTVAVAYVYLGIMSPSSIACDASWFHMSAAEDYVREGRFVAQIGDWAKALPHLTSVLHTWAFLIPGLSVVHGWMLGQHGEFVLFLFTLLAVVPTVRFLRNTNEGHSAAWTAFFLFPSIFVYDSNLGGAADHVQAFFVLPFLLAALRTLEKPDPRMAALCGVMAGAAFLTKVQAVYVVLPVTLLLVAACLLALTPALRRNAPLELRARCWALTAFGLAALAVLSPSLLKNVVFHRNPVYPFAMNVFTGSWPAMPDAHRLFFEHLAPVASGSFWDNALRALRTVFTFSFEVHNPHFPRRLPFIGSLFTLLIPAALLSRDRRTWAALFISLTALFLWTYTFPVARNLQTFLPLLVVVTAASMAAVWGQGWAPRAVLIPLVALQLAWGGDVALAGGAERTEDAIALVRSGIDGKSKNRFASYFSGTRALDKALPKDAVVLLHTSYRQLGIRRRTLLDWPGFQGLIDYRPMRQARDVFDRFAELGITHIATSPEWPAHSRQEEAVFGAFLHRHAKPLGKIGEFVMFEMPRERPPGADPYEVLCLGIAGYPDGLYRVEALDNLDDGRRSPKSPDVPLPLPLDSLPGEDSLLDRAEVVFLGENQSPDAGALVGDGALRGAFTQVAKYGDYTVHLKRRP